MKTNTRTLASLTQEEIGVACDYIKGFGLEKEPNLSETENCVFLLRGRDQRECLAKQIPSRLVEWRRRGFKEELITVFDRQSVVEVFKFLGVSNFNQHLMGLGGHEIMIVTYGNITITVAFTK